MSSGIEVNIIATPTTITEGGLVKLRASTTDETTTTHSFAWQPEAGTVVALPGVEGGVNAAVVGWDTSGLRASSYRVGVAVIDSAGVSNFADVEVQPRPGAVLATLQRTDSNLEPPSDLALWVTIRRSSRGLGFRSYAEAMDTLLCGPPSTSAVVTDAQARFTRLRSRRFLPFNDTDAYRFLKVATEAFLITNCGVAIDQHAFTQEDLDDVVNRLSTRGQDINLNDLRNRYLDSLGDGSTRRGIPYLALVRSKLQELGLRQSVFANDPQGDDRVDLPEDCYALLEVKLTSPLLLELIWSYWHEEGMLVQSMNAISRRFQNIRGPGDRDPLASFETDPLRPLNNLLWGYIQDEQHRLTLVRRGYEYDHHYGISLVGKAVPNLRPVDSRSQFLEAFHNLLYHCTEFFRQDDDTTVIADGFPLLNALREVHLLLTQGAHNQFGDLPSTARQEMLIQQWLLARPEFREFLPTRIMVDYPEPWMDRVETMKTLQGWTDTSILHFHSLGVFGEQLLLSIRYGLWSDPGTLPRQATFWARFWRGEMQGYIHAYRAVTGIDLAADVTDNQRVTERYLPPSVHLQRRLIEQQRKELPAARPVAIPVAPQRALRGNGRK